MPSDSSDRRLARQQQNPVLEQDHLRCPRCDSTNTKFCYYNNYNLSQPRHFCKSCRRYWTKGGTLRNIPVGGGSRKNTKRSRTSSAPQDPLSAVPVSVSPPSEPDMSVSVRDECGGVPGSFSSLLATSSPGYLALGEPFLHRGGFGLGLGSGTGSGFEEEMGFGLGRAVWPLAEVGEAGGTTWQLMNGEGFGDGDCFAWPELAISTPAKGLQ